MNDAENSIGRGVLVYPRTGIDIPNTSVFMPLSVIKPAEALRSSRFAIQVIDMRTDPDWTHTLKREIERSPLFVGISAMTGEQIKWGLKAAKLVRKLAPDVPLIWGGIHASILPDQTLEDPLVDAVVIGPGEQILVELAMALAKGDREKVVGKAHKAIFEAQTSAIYDYDNIAWRNYVTPIADNVRGLAHVSSRGCPHQCAFCYNHSLNGRHWRADDPEDVLAQIEKIISLGILGILFFDDNFFVHKSRVEKIAQGILERGINPIIKVDCRADYIIRYDDEFLDFIKRAGIRALYVGAESGSDRILTMLQKDCDVDTIIESNRKLKQHGIRPHYSFMTGLPGETIDDVKATLDLMLRIKQDNPMAYLSPLKHYLPYPGTALFEKAKDAGFEPPKTLRDWSCFSWNQRNAPWFTKTETRYIEKAMYVSLGLDSSAVELSGIKRNRLFTFGFNKFSSLCKSRCNRPNLGLIPELPAIRLVRKIKGM